MRNSTEKLEAILIEKLKRIEDPTQTTTIEFGVNGHEVMVTREEEKFFSSLHEKQPAWSLVIDGDNILVEQMFTTEEVVIEILKETSPF